MLSAAHAKEKSDDRKVFLQILANIRLFGRQGLALRGHDDAESNFMQLISLQKATNPSLAAWMERRSHGVGKYSSPEMQNEVLKLMSLSILRSIAKDIQSSDCFTVMADECTDVANREQPAICFRWVDSKLDVHEEFIGLYQIENISAATIPLSHPTVFTNFRYGGPKSCKAHN